MRWCATALCAGILALIAVAVTADPVVVRYPEGVLHGFLILRTTDGAAVADGDLFQNVRGDTVTAHLVYHFKDGSLSDETTVFSQRGRFRVLSDHLVQKGPSFKQAIDMTVDAAHNHVTVHYADDHGASKTDDQQMTLPPDLANGVTLTLLKNVKPSALPKSWSMVVATPSPRLVKLEPSNAGEAPFTTSGVRRSATHYVIKIDLGGLTGAIAGLIGKQPPDTHVWIAGGEAPAFVKSEGPMAIGTPVWRTELVSPVWPNEAARR